MPCVEELYFASEVLDCLYESQSPHRAHTTRFRQKTCRMRSQACRCKALQVEGHHTFVYVFYVPCVEDYTATQDADDGVLSGPRL